MWVFFDRDNLYVSARMATSEPEGKRGDGNAPRRQQSVQQRSLRRVVRRFLRSPQRLRLHVNVSGALLDWSTTNDAPNNKLERRLGRQDEHVLERVAVEIRFPFRSFRHREGGTIWG